MPIGIEATAPKTSIGADQASKRGVEAPAPANAFVFGPTGAYLTRGIGVAPSGVDSEFPR